MSKKSSGGIGIFTIIFWVFVFYIIFHDGEKKDETVVVEQERSPEISQPLKDDLDKVIKDVTTAIGHAKDRIEEMKNEVSQEDEIKSNKQKPGDKKEAIETETTPKEKEQEPMDTGFKKL